MEQVAFYNLRDNRINNVSYSVYVACHQHFYNLLTIHILTIRIGTVNVETVCLLSVYVSLPYSGFVSVFCIVLFVSSFLRKLFPILVVAFVVVGFIVC